MASLPIEKVISSRALLVSGKNSSEGVVNNLTMLLVLVSRITKAELVVPKSIP
jgi:hypothetical protein